MLILINVVSLIITVCRMSILINGHVAVPNLRVKGHHYRTPNPPTHRQHRKSHDRLTVDLFLPSRKHPSLSLTEIQYGESF